MIVLLFDFFFNHLLFYSWYLYSIAYQILINLIIIFFSHFLLLFFKISLILSFNVDQMLFFRCRLILFLLCWDFYFLSSFNCRIDLFFFHIQTTINRNCRLLFRHWLCFLLCLISDFFHILWKFLYSLRYFWFNPFK